MEKWFRASRRPQQGESWDQRIAQYISALCGLPPPWGLADRNHIGTPFHGDTYKVWNLRGKLGTGISGRLYCENPGVENPAGIGDFILLTWKRAQYPINDLISAMVPFIEMYSPELVTCGFYHSYEDVSDWKEFAVESGNPEYIAALRRCELSFLAMVNYWSTELCASQFDKTPDEIVRILAGHVQKVERIGDGVLVVFSDEFRSLEDQIEWNRRIRPLLGGYGMFSPPPWYQPSEEFLRRLHPPPPPPKPADSPMPDHPFKNQKVMHLAQIEYLERVLPRYEAMLMEASRATLRKGAAFVHRGEDRIAVFTLQGVEWLSSYCWKSLLSGVTLFWRNMPGDVEEREEDFPYGPRYHWHFPLYRQDLDQSAIERAANRPPNSTLWNVLPDESNLDEVMEDIAACWRKQGWGWLEKPAYSRERTDVNIWLHAKPRRRKGTRPGRSPGQGTGNG